MNIHEYQAKALLRSYGAPVSDGRVVLKAEEAKTAAGEMDGPLWVVKAQIHAGGRGKGSFKEADAGDKGGVRLTKSVEEAAEEAKKMLGTVELHKGVLNHAAAGRMARAGWRLDEGTVEHGAFAGAVGPAPPANSADPAAVTRPARYRSGI